MAEIGSASDSAGRRDSREDLSHATSETVRSVGAAMRAGRGASDLLLPWLVRPSPDTARRSIGGR
jgi:hypothetical protein